MKYLGIDYGTKRIGVAVSDDTGSLAFPLGTVQAGLGALEEVASLVRENAVQKIIIGESRNNSGQANDVMEDIEQFKKDIAELTNLPVEYEREFFTSAMAARQFAPEPKSRKANPSHATLDASAAALVLQSYLDRNKK
ncbi:MAG: Holliday junction resolvase RuvX [Candidatus Pacebacteria bacterium]|nr:Holliday junction resolvase RuvX [Candidatus Paceibacterota bacterium]